MQNEHEYIELIQPTPTLHTKKCKVLAKAIAATLFTLPYIAALILWYNYDLFVGIVTLGISYLIVGIVRSKLRTISIPPHQLEYNYNDTAIATWYAAKRLCYEKIEDNPPI